MLRKNDDAKDVAAGLIRDVGFDPTYEADSGPALAYRFERFEEVA